MPAPARSSYAFSLRLLGPIGLALLALPFTAQAQQPAEPAPAEGGAAASGAVTLDASGLSGDGNADAAATASGEAQAAPVDDEAARWAERDRRVNESGTIDGASGLLRTKYAQGLASGQFRVQFLTDFFSSGWLCTSERPCVSPGRAGRSTDDHMSHVGGTLSLGVGITKWLEAYASTAAYASSDSSNDPQLIQVLGDTSLGAKVYAPIGGKVFHIGGAAELWLLNGTGNVGLAGDATSAKFHALGTADLRGLQKPLPLRFGLNVSYSIDNSGAIAEPTETIRRTPITRIERFSLRVNRVDHIDFKLGAEAFFVKERLRPFVEYSIDVPVNRQGYECYLNNPSSDGCMANDKVAPSRLTLGARVLPWKRGFAVTGAFDIGVSGVHAFIEEMAPQAPWTLWLGLGWAVDTHDRPAVTTAAPVVAPSHGPLTGTVRDKETNEGIHEAVVSFVSHPDRTALSTSADGTFHSDVPPGEYRLAVKAEGYEPGECGGVVPDVFGQRQAGAPAQAIDCALQALPKVGSLSGRVHDDTGAAVESAKLSVRAGETQSGTTSGQGGSFKLENLSPGTTTVTIEAEGYFPATRSVTVKAREDVALDVELHKRPKNANVSVSAKEIVIKQQVQFAHNSAEILPASNTLLEEIADALRQNPRIKKVEVQGHTDNTGTADYNEKLSDQRAGAVRSWLVDKGGIAGDRLTSKGYGQSRPLVPNVTATNRARNRRVQFVILEQDPAPTATKATSTKATTAAPKASVKKAGGDDNLKLDLGKP